MGQGQFPRTAAGRVNDAEMRRIDAAARLKGLVRAQWVRHVLLRAADTEIRAAASGEALETGGGR